MRKLNPYLILCSFLPLVFFSACEEEDTLSLNPETEVPAISVTAPGLSATNEVSPTVGKTVTFTITVSDNAALSQVFVNGEAVKTYMGEITEGVLSYDFPVANVEVTELQFSVEDAWRNTTNGPTVIISPVAAVDEAYVLLDLGGASTGNESKTVVDWDVRTLFNFNVASPHSSSATAEVAASQARLSFAMPNPDGSGKALEIVKQPVDPDNNWGGWANIIFNLKNPIPEETVTALPQYDAENIALTPGTKVIKLDVYYDATVDPDYSWEDLIATTDVWNSDPALGYKIELVLANYEEHANTESGYDNNGYYISYSAYLPEPNKWHTLTFETLNEDKVGKFGGATAAEVDAINLRPAPGYSGVDGNSLYIKNLRIEEVEE